MNDKKIYFASDFHLGIPDKPASLEREKHIVQWLDSIKDDAEALYLVGDLFDFWFEYKRVVPKGFVRLLGKLAELRDSGLPIHCFTGNHDLWMFGYFEEELDIPVYKQPVTVTLKGKKFVIGHGDGIGPRDHGYKFIKRIFTNKICQWLFARIHPNLGIAIADYWSKKSRLANGTEMEQFLGEEEEWQIIYAKDRLQQEHIDYFIFGHRHLPLDIPLNGKSRFINLGDWITHYSYVVFDGEKLELKYFEKH